MIYYLLLLASLLKKIMNSMIKLHETLLLIYHGLIQQGQLCSRGQMWKKDTNMRSKDLLMLEKVRILSTNLQALY